MKRTRRNLALKPFDAVRYLGDEEAIAEYLLAIRETGDPRLMELALGDVERARASRPTPNL